MAEINVAETVKKIVVENLERKPEEVTDDARFIEDLGADSLDLTELLMALEEEYNVEIDDDEFASGYLVFAVHVASLPSLWS